MRAQWRKKLVGNRKRKLAQREKIEKEEMTHNVIGGIHLSSAGMKVSCLRRDFQLFSDVKAEIGE